MEMNVQYRNL